MPIDLINHDLDLSIKEAFDLIIKAVLECKRQDAEKAEIEYERLIGKTVSCVGGEPHV